MIKQLLKNISIFSLILLFSAAVFAQNSGKTSTAVEKLEWNSDENAFEYEVEIRDKSTGSIEKITTSDNFINVSKLPGNYDFRVTSIDFLGREGSVSEWQSFTVTKALVPAINSVPVENVHVPKVAGDTVSIPVNVTNVTNRTKIQLVNNKTGSVIDAKYATKGSGSDLVVTEINVSGITEGNWTVRVTDASGKVSESKKILIDNPWPEIARQEMEEEKQRQKEEEKQRAQEEKQRQEEEKRQAEEQEKEQQRQEEDRKAEQKRQVEEERREEEARKQAEKEEKRIARQHKRPELFASIGGACFFNLMDTTLVDFSEMYKNTNILPGLKADIAFVPFKTKNGSWKFGIGADVLVSQITSNENSNFTPKFTFELFQLDFILHKKLIKDKLYLTGKLGSGVFITQINLEYKYYNGQRSSDVNKNYGYITSQFGAGLMWLPLKHIFVEIGCDYNMIFIPKMTTSFLTPNLNIGVHF